jgi:hypothetical protein
MHIERMSATDCLLNATDEAMRLELARVLNWNATVYLRQELASLPAQRNGASSDPRAHAIVDAIMKLDLARLRIGQ